MITHKYHKNQEATFDQSAPADWTEHAIHPTEISFLYNVLPILQSGLKGLSQLLPLSSLFDQFCNEGYKDPRQLEIKGLTANSFSFTCKFSVHPILQ